VAVAWGGDEAVKELEKATHRYNVAKGPKVPLDYREWATETLGSFDVTKVDRSVLEKIVSRLRYLRDRKEDLSLAKVAKNSLVRLIGSD
jgi:uncharacterized lipoprotein YehR (DUF1307 family)